MKGKWFIISETIITGCMLIVDAQDWMCFILFIALVLFFKFK